MNALNAGIALTPQIYADWKTHKYNRFTYSVIATYRYLRAYLSVKLRHHSGYDVIVTVISSRNHENYALVCLMAGSPPH